MEFACENALLGRMLYALSHAGTDALFRIGYTVRDPEAAKAALLAHAMHDAAEKARVLAEASGVALGAIQSIEHSRGEVSLEVQPVNRMFASDAAPLGKAAYDVDFTPDDIQVSDTVTAVWEIL